MTGLRFLFRVTLRRLDLAAAIYHLREPQKCIQVVMSPDETRRLLAVASSLKVRMLLSLWLWLRPACERGGPAEGQAYRQGTEDHPRRTVQGQAKTATSCCRVDGSSWQLAYAVGGPCSFNRAKNP